MKRSPTLAGSVAPLRVVLITLDHHMSGAVDVARERLRADLPGLDLSVHAATDWDAPEDGTGNAALERARADIAAGDIVMASMLFVEDHVKAILPALEARKDACDAMMCCMSSAEVMKATRMGAFDMGREPKGVVKLLRKLRGDASRKKDDGRSAGERQMRMLRRLPKMLKYIPGTAQDVRNYFLTLQYRLAASPENIESMVRLLVDRYATGDRAALRGHAPAPPVEYPETGVYHPSLTPRLHAGTADLPRDPARAKVGLLVLRSYLLSGDTGHYDGVIRALEERGLDVVPCFCNGLDMRPAIDAFLRDPSDPIDALVSLTGFSLVGGPAYSDAEAAAEALTGLDVPYLSAHVTEFQSLERWEASEQGLMPIESTIMVAIPELDGATGSLVYGGRRDGEAPCTCGRREGNCERGRACMQPHPERVATLADRVEKLVRLRRAPKRERRVAVPIFAFPPNAGNVGSAAFLSVFESLHATLVRLAAEGYDVGEVPADAEAVRVAVLEGNAGDTGALGNVHARIATDDHVRREPHLAEIEAQWGPAPGRDMSDGRSIFVLGARFGNVLVCIQPGFGYEGDPMRLLFERGFAPTHAFCAFYRYLREDFDAHAILHFGTHGALEFMPGKQVGMSADCWPDRLIGATPNLYLYAANNPSEGAIAKRRSAATLVSYLTPPLTEAGLYRGLADLRGSLDRLRALPADDAAFADTAQMVRAQAEQVNLADDLPGDDERLGQALAARLVEVEQSLIPDGLHVVGRGMDDQERADMIRHMAAARTDATVPDAMVERIVAGERAAIVTRDEVLAAALDDLARTDAKLRENGELDGLMRALDGRFVPPSPSGDLLRTPDILPTGRNTHGFDPFRIPSAYAVRDGARQAAKVLERHLETDGALPESIAIVLWGTDNLKSEGAPLAQAMALMGTRPRHDSYGRVTGAELIPLDELKRPRIDVVMTLSGIFRDLLPLQSKMLAEAAWLAATADEPFDQNFVAKHVAADAAARGVSQEEAALRVFSNAEGAYGSNVNYLISSSAWEGDDEIAATYAARKSFAIDRKGRTEAQPEQLDAAMARVDLAYQNLDSVELGVTTIDHYFDTLGGISRLASRAQGRQLPVYISDQSQGEGRVRTLGEQVSLETHTRSLNPRWFEGMLAHGHEGVRQIESQITNTMGWSATTGEVQPWVYQRLSETFVLDEAMRRRLAELNPASSARLVNRLIEAHERQYWQPDDATREALQRASEEMEDAVEGVVEEA